MIAKKYHNTIIYFLPDIPISMLYTSKISQIHYNDTILS